MTMTREDFVGKLKAQHPNIKANKIADVVSQSIGMHVTIDWQKWLQIILQILSGLGGVLGQPNPAPAPAPAPAPTKSKFTEKS